LFSVAGVFCSCPCGYKTKGGLLWRNGIFLNFTTGNALNTAETQFSVQSWTSDATSTELAMHMNPSNIYNYNGGLEFRVSAYANNPPVQTAEMDSDLAFLYGSFTFHTTVPSVPGVCYSMFLYRDDTHEIDIEFLSSDPEYYETIHYTNQPGSTSGAYKVDTYAGQDYTAFHTHRIDWLPTHTQFFVNDVLRQTISVNVPQVSLNLIYNIWSNGDPGWTYGPPTSAATATIQNLGAYYNASGTTDAQFVAACKAAGSPSACPI